MRPDRVLVVTTSPRLPTGLLSRAGWAALAAGPVFSTAERAEALGAGSDLPVAVLHGEPDVVVAELAAATTHGPAVWLAGGDGEDPVLAALRERAEAAGGRLVVEVVAGSWDPPGARLLDVVAVMDRLRSPGGCPWDAEQTHDTLRRYLLEETYEAYDALVDGDLVALREELGDVLLQVVFHARLAEEADRPWTVDDVAADLVAKLVRRHPHVFADRAVDGAAEVATNWEQIKRAEKGRTSVTDGLARSQPALALAQALVRRADAAGLPRPAGPAASPAVGELLLAAVVRAQETGLDAEAELRAAADRYADRLRHFEGEAAPGRRTGG